MTEPRYSVVSEVTFPLPRWVKASFPVLRDGDQKTVLLASMDEIASVKEVLRVSGFRPAACSRCEGWGHIKTQEGIGMRCYRCRGRGYVVLEYGDGDGFDHINEGEREDEAIWQEHQRESEAPYRP